MNTATTFDLATTFANLKKAFKGVLATRVELSIDNHGAQYVTVHHYAATILRIAADGSAVIDNGGHYSATTKKHINTALYTAGVNASVCQRKHEWYATVNGTEQAFNRYTQVPA